MPYPMEQRRDILECYFSVNKNLADTLRKFMRSYPGRRLPRRSTGHQSSPPVNPENRSDIMEKSLNYTSSSVVDYSNMPLSCYHKFGEESKCRSPHSNKNFLTEIPAQLSPGEPNDLSMSKKVLGVDESMMNKTYAIEKKFQDERGFKDKE
ncbi:unnamed protein product [Phaedon cochleariae]|uniref:DUF4817 domain-containing protein n=1 Tax=Phaedon cochleariae TaxID=80249 RepID=A0A9P0DQL5_PHACE|nr:unnamed protein product [Phaedon cochleariae]